MITGFSTFAILTLLTEEITNIIKKACPKFMTPCRKGPTAIVVGIALALATKAGILFTLGLDVTYPVIDYIATGIIISRSSNFLHDLIEQANIDKHIKRSRRK